MVINFLMKGNKLLTLFSRTQPIFSNYTYLVNMDFWYLFYHIQLIHTIKKQKNSLIPNSSTACKTVKQRKKIMPAS